MPPPPPYTDQALIQCVEGAIKNRPEAIYGQRSPWPAHQHCNGSFKVGRAADTEGTMSCRIQGKSVCISICLSIHLSTSMSICPELSSGWLAGWGDRHTDRRTDRQMEVCTDFPYILQDIVPYRPPAQKKAEDITIASRSRPAEVT